MITARVYQEAGIEWRILAALKSKSVSNKD
jgi:hypothetical protein